MKEMVEDNVIWHDLSMKYFKRNFSFSSATEEAHTIKQLNEKERKQGESLWLNHDHGESLQPKRISLTNGHAHTNNTNHHNYPHNKWKRNLRIFHKLQKNWEEGRCTVKVLSSSRRVYSVFFEEQYKRLWSGNAKGMLKQWHLDTGAPLNEIRGHDGAVNCLKVASISSGTLQSLEAENEMSPSEEGEERRGGREEDTTAQQQDDEMSSHLLFSCSFDRRIKIWPADLRGGSRKLSSLTLVEPLAELVDDEIADAGGGGGGPVVPCAHEGPVVGLQLHRDCVYSCALDETMKIFDLREGGGRLAAKLRDTSSLRCIQVEPTAQQQQQPLVISGGSDGFVKVWDPRAGNDSKSACVFKCQSGLNKVMALHFDRQQLFIGGDTSGWGSFPVIVYDLRGVMPSLLNLKTRNNQPSCLLGHSDRIWTLHTCGNKLVTGSRDNNIRVWCHVGPSGDGDLPLSPRPDPDIREGGRNSPIASPRLMGGEDGSPATSYVLGNALNQHKNSIYWLHCSYRR